MTLFSRKFWVKNSHEDSLSLIKGVGENIKNEAKDQKSGCLGMLLGTAGTTLLENMLERKGVLRVTKRKIRAARAF